MGRPKAYDAQKGYMYQIFVKSPHDRELESLDHARDFKDLKHLLNEYNMAYRGQGLTLSYIKLPKKYWA